jgi:ribosomal protein S21
MSVNAVVYPKYPGEPADVLIRDLKKQLTKSGMLADLRGREEFLPKPVRRRMRAIAARKRRGFA